MKQKTKGLVAQVAIAVTGLALGLAAAAFFNLAGLTWTADRFDSALFWEPLESAITVVLGCLLLLGWLISVIALGVFAAFGYRRGRWPMWTGIVFAATSFVLVGAALVIALIILPTVRVGHILSSWG